jgi:hypothetical protein
VSGINKSKREFPYFKIQQFDKSVYSWKSYKDANFTEEGVARTFVREQETGKKLRIMKVEKNSTTPLEDI